MRRLPGPHRTLQKIYGEMVKFMKVEINQHKKDWDPAEPRDFIDCYLTEIQKVGGQTNIFIIFSIVKFIISI